MKSIFHLNNFRSAKARVDSGLSDIAAVVCGGETRTFACRNGNENDTTTAVKWSDIHVGGDGEGESVSKGHCMGHFRQEMYRMSIRHGRTRVPGKTDF